MSIKPTKQQIVDVLKENPDRLEATPGKLLPVMIKAIQELSAHHESLLVRQTNLENLVNGLMNK